MRRPIGPLEFTRRTWVRLWLLVVFVFLYAPIVVLVAFSFNQSRRNIVWTGFTTDWYGRALNNASLIEAFVNSIVIALISTVFSVIIGGLLALGLYRFRFPGKPVLDGASALPIVIPEICMGVALLVFYARVGWPTGLPWPLNLSSVIIGHIVFSFPFVAVVVRARMEGFDRSLEEASKDLGASEWQTFWNVTLPYMKTGLIAGALLAMTLSLDDFVITFFTSGPDTITFPVKIYSMVRQSVTPEVNAASTILILFTVALTIIALRLQKPSEGIG
ncbi:MAG TPA: ABC transporter permease [Geminicoccus sp.]|jgi:spermidine/putrescine transport system permease protein|uniref:ABC transporter permease n=1 Tax=Geminicoccus sp. TaxID=2024832 RepID=UPI002E330587|nr:ABC transporter permease [Geminicoccus sp.]HEX2525379.1 ABC transporter permease [Geminicoccus sp.]